MRQGKVLPKGRGGGKEEEESDNDDDGRHGHQNHHLNTMR
jgi:hypothetical protein